MSTQSHNNWKEQLPAYLLAALSPVEKIDLEHHLGGCAECQAELRWLEPAKHRLVEQVEQVEPSPGLKKRLMAAVEADLAENPVDAPAESPVVGTRPEPVPAPQERREDRTPRKSWFDFGQLLRPAALGAMAAVLFAGVIIGYGVRGGGETGSDGPVLAERVIPDTAKVGNTEAVMVTSGNSGTLKITNLPELEEGEVYQAWTQKGQAISPTDSLFTPRSDGTATASIPDLDGVSTVMVSAEPAGGSEQPTTAPIITIPIPS